MIDREQGEVYYYGSPGLESTPFDKAPKIISSSTEIAQRVSQQFFGESPPFNELYLAAYFDDMGMNVSGVPFLPSVLKLSCTGPWPFKVNQSAQSFLFQLSIARISCVCTCSDGSVTHMKPEETGGFEGVALAKTEDQGLIRLVVA